MPTFALNFSRPGSEVIAQYYMLTSLGRSGYTTVMQNAQAVATHISSSLEEMGPYRLISRGDQLPVFAFTLTPDVKNYSVYDVSARMRQRGWLIPAYSFPENRQDLNVLRIVVRAGMSLDMADDLIAHFRDETHELESLSGPFPHTVSGPRKAFAH
jgi:glutamate decarboxylase